MDAEWYTKTFEKAIQIHGKPKIISTYQESQFTSDEFTAAILGKEIRLSMDGKGMAPDNAFIERLWRSIKYKQI